MKDKVWELTMIVLGSIGAIILVWLLIYLSNRPMQVDCEKYYKPGNGYIPVPKQCEKGEK